MRLDANECRTDTRDVPERAAHDLCPQRVVMPLATTSLPLKKFKGIIASQPHVDRFAEKRKNSALLSSYSRGATGGGSSAARHC